MADFGSYLSAFFIALAAVFLLKPVAVKIGLTDDPGGRKQHAGAIPLIGGIAMFLGFLFAMLGLGISLDAYRAFIAGMALIVIVGVLDDLHELNTRSRFIVQIIAALLMVLWGEVVISDVGRLLYSEVTSLGAWAIPFTVFGVVGVVNALNMSDGIDGLAGGLVLVSLVFMSVLAFSGGHVADGQVILVLVSAVLAFLWFNFPLPGRKQAKVFMGDAGSMFLGFALAWFAVSLSQGEGRAMSPVTALWLMALPLMDTVSVMIRRVIRGRSPFSPDREHFHHVLLVAGYGTRKTVYIMMTLAVALALIGVAAEFLGVPEYLMFYLFLVIFGAYFWGMMHAWQVMKMIRVEK